MFLVRIPTAGFFAFTLHILGHFLVLFSSCLMAFMGYSMAYMQCKVSIVIVVLLNEYGILTLFSNQLVCVFRVNQNLAVKSPPYITIH